jgi:hypothetical protein
MAEQTVIQGSGMQIANLLLQVARLPDRPSRRIMLTPIQNPESREAPSDGCLPTQREIAVDRFETRPETMTYGS